MALSRNGKSEMMLGAAELECASAASRRGSEQANSKAILQEQANSNWQFYKSKRIPMQQKANCKRKQKGTKRILYVFRL